MIEFFRGCSATHPQPSSSTSGLQSGENTLNVLCALRGAQTLVSGRFSDLSRPEPRAAVVSDYIVFLTTPGTHNDTYAESFHRSFFADWQDTRPTSPGQVNEAPPVGSVRFWLSTSTLSFFFLQVLKFAEARSKQMLSCSHPDGQLNAIGCLTTVLPFILLSASANEEQAVCVASSEPIFYCC